MAYRDQDLQRFYRTFLYPLLISMLITPFASAADEQAEASAAHAAVFEQTQFPSATTCGDCHPKHYSEWSVSQHAYAQVSPIFNAMSSKIVKLSSGTNGDFCIRCHTPVGMNLEESVFMSNIDRHPTSREGVTCIACHRLTQSYGKLSGRLHVADGAVTAPIFGPTGNTEELNKAIAKSGLVTDAKSSGRQIHGDIEGSAQMSTPGFCGACHDVNLVNGFRLEEAFSEFKNAPANKQGITCQDCHMGKEPGKILAAKDDPEFTHKNYDFGPAAKVGSLTTAPRKLTNHMFVGPDYSILPPSLFPFDLRAIKEEHEKDDVKARGMATIREWLEFDWKAGWGTDEFEESLDPDFAFPERWESVDDRYDARLIINDNLALLKKIADERLKLLRTGYVLGDIEAKPRRKGGFDLTVEVRNGTDGHNVPTGFDAERLVWLYVRVVDADGKVVKVSGDLDPNGDVRDLHSAYVHNHEMPLDDELVSLQSKFVTRNIVGGEREQVLAINYSASPLVFLRPSQNPTILQGRPNGARKHKQGIEPNGSRFGRYEVSKEALASGRPPFKAVVELKAAMVPVNLVNEVKDVGFDFSMSARDVAEVLVHGHVDKDGKPVIWNPDSAELADNVVVGHQVLWTQEKNL